MVSGITFKSLIHFKLIFVSGVRSGSNFILLMWLSVSPAPFVEETILSPLSILGSVVKDQLTLYAWVYFWALNSVPLVYVSVFMPVPYCFDYNSLVV